MINDEEVKQSEAAFRWIKTQNKKLIEKFANSAEYISDTQPMSFFMAGSPGAGKTEISKRLIAHFKQKPIRIDADEIRSFCEGYTGENAHVFQKAATKGVHILYEHALKKNINAILDGTFAYNGSLENIQRSLDRKRKVEIYFIYQDPLQAWEFTKKREAIEHRKVSKEIFIKSFFKSRENTNKAKEYFSSSIELNLIVKDFEKDLERLEINITKIDPFIEKVYTEEQLNKLLL
jgi:predicted ABC-type ATPase